MSDIADEAGIAKARFIYILKARNNCLSLYPSGIVTVLSAVWNMHYKRMRTRGQAWRDRQDTSDVLL